MRQPFIVGGINKVEDVVEDKVLDEKEAAVVKEEEEEEMVAINAKEAMHGLLVTWMTATNYGNEK